MQRALRAGLLALFSCGGSFVTIPAQVHLHNKFLVSFPTGVPWPSFSSAAQAGLPAFPQQAALICSGMMRCPHEGTQNSSCCSSREKHKARSGPLRGHPAALGRICLLPRALGQCATTANKDPVLQRRELAAAPIQHLTSLTLLEGKGRSWLSVPSGTNLCVC